MDCPDTRGNSISRHLLAQVTSRTGRFTIAYGVPRKQEALSSRQHHPGRRALSSSGYETNDSGRRTHKIVVTQQQKRKPRERSEEDPEASFGAQNRAP
ncbi:hypothetical protein L596_010760 [Steinernema carpocapsae]|uniref:Uncharacterized protein n=1 Tax=Steinernema carpocapsae TaxID=34508 RepID=A0A4U5PJF4_STECR|nr:hypothetical protein L596_010760 [Steinernema carpocapsae]